MRSAITSITCAARLRRRTEPLSGPTPRAARDLKAPIPPGRQRVPRRPNPIPPEPAQSGWIARWFGLGRSRPAYPKRSPLADSDAAPFTPETHPGLSPEACTILNTPVEECDPEILRLILSGLAVHIAETLQLGEADAKAMFGTLWQRLGSPLGDPPNTAPDEAPASSMAAPDAPPAEPPDARVPRVPNTPATAAAAAPQAPPNAAMPRQPVLHRSRLLRPKGDRLFRCGRSIFPRFLRDKQRSLLPQRLCYAACAGPP